MTAYSQRDEDMPHSDWQIDITPLLIKVGVDDTVQSVSMFAMRNRNTGVILWSMIWGENTTLDEVVTAVVTKMQEILEKEKHLHRIFLDNSSFSKCLAEQLIGLASEHHLLIQIMHSQPRGPRGRGRIESSYKTIADYIKLMPGYIDYRHDENTKVDAGNLLTLSKLEQIMTDFIKKWNQSQ